MWTLAQLRTVTFSSHAKNVPSIYRVLVKYRSITRDIDVLPSENINIVHFGVYVVKSILSLTLLEQESKLCIEFSI